MDSYLSEDSEELFRRYDIVGPELRNGYGLVGIVSVYRLAELGHQRDILYNLRGYRDIMEAICGAFSGDQKELALLMIQKGTGVSYA
jgi:hypothetical protein